MPKIQKIKKWCSLALSAAMALQGFSVPVQAAATPKVAQSVQAVAVSSSDYEAEIRVTGTVKGEDADAGEAYSEAGYYAPKVTAGLDRFVLTTGSGGSRFLASSEYAITSVTVPADKDGRNYQVCYSESVGAGPEDYQTEQAYYGTTESEQTFSLPDGTAAVSVRYQDISDATLSFTADVSFALSEEGDVTAYAYLYDEVGLAESGSSLTDEALSEEVDQADESLYDGTVSRAAASVTGVQKIEAIMPYSAGNYLNGWTVSATWGDGEDASDAYIWNATTEDSKKPTLVVKYSHDNADQDYAAGDIQFTIPDFGLGKRDGSYSADTTTGTDLSEWSCKHDTSAGTYVFTNKFSVSKGQSLEGGFQLAWTVSARESKNGYYKEASPAFTLNGTDSLELPALSYSFTSKRDQYRLSLSYDTSDNFLYQLCEGFQNYNWDGVTVRYDRDAYSRGLSQWKNTYTITFPTAVGEDDILVYVDGVKASLTKVSDTEYTFNESASEEIIRGTKSTNNYDIVIGVKNDVLPGKVLTLESHLDRLYLDEETWVTAAQNTDEVVDGSVEITLHTYSFTWNGNIYTTEKATHGGYETNAKGEPSTRTDKLPADSLYSGKTITFTISGQAANGSDVGLSIDREKKGLSLPSTAVSADASTETYGSRFKETSGNTSGTSKVAVGDAWYMFLGDDRITATLNDGSVRNLTDSEYDIEAVTLYPALSPGYGSFELYGAKSQNTPFEDYTLLKTGESDKTSVILPDGYKSVFVVYKNIADGALRQENMDLYVNIHLNWEEESAKEESERIDPEGKLTNFNLFRALYEASDGIWANDCAQASASGNDVYDGTYGSVLAVHDKSLYDEYFLRAYSQVYLRELSAVYYAGSDIAEFTEDGDDSYTSTITASAYIKPGEKGITSQVVSVYSEVPEGLTTDKISLDTVTVPTLLKSKADVSVEKFERNGKTYIGVHYDFSSKGTYPLKNLPVGTTKLMDFSFSYKVYEDGTNLSASAHKYTSYTYIMLDDLTGPLDIKGNIMSDHYDIDGDGDTDELMGYGSDIQLIQEDLDEWRQYVEKHVKSYYSGDYVTSTRAKLYEADDTEADKEKSAYSYRLAFALGSNGAKDIVLYDHIESGAVIADNSGQAGTTTQIDTEWHGTLQSVDTSYASSMGFIPTVYYSEDEDAENDLTDSTWSTVKTDNARSIAVKLDTSGFTDGIYTGHNAVYVVVNMLAPSDESLVGKLAVNQYEADYDSYQSDGTLDQAYTLKSSETYVELDTERGTFRLKKVDQDTQEIMSDVAFNLYDSEKQMIYQGVKTDENGLITRRLLAGTYYYEEKEQVEGYEELTGLHEFTVTAGGATEVTVENIPLQDIYSLTVDKELLERYDPYGNGTFLFEVICTEGRMEGRRFVRAIDLRDTLTGTFTIDHLYAGTYEVRELSTSRYTFVKADNVKGFTVDGRTGTAVLKGEDKDAEIKYTNDIGYWDKYSHETYVCNSVGTETE